MLKDVEIRAARSGSTLKKLSDGEGLQLWLMPGGAKVWRLAYRFLGKQKSVVLGSYPALTLADARIKRADAKRMLENGTDPSRAKQEAKIRSTENAANTFEIIAAELLSKKRAEGKASATIGKREWLYSLANGHIGRLPVRDITARDVLRVLKEIEGKGHNETAHRLRAAIGEVFRFAIAGGIAETDPTAALKGALVSRRVQHRAAITEAKAFGGLLRAIDGFEGQFTTRSALQLMALLFPRPGELRQAKWQEFDLEKAEWCIPAARTKMRRNHRLPLPRQALEIFRSLQPLTGNGKEGFVFPAFHTVMRPMSENTLNGALRRLGFSAEQMTSHGFRATASTLLNESRLFAPDAIERALGHQDNDSIRRAYARGAFWDERVRMAQWWADHLDMLKSGAEIVPFGKRA